MGQKAVHCGPAGNGQAAKICNNMILGATMIVTCEAFALADKLGLDRQAMFDVVSTSSGQSWSMNTYCPAPGIGPQSPADNGYTPGFAAELMLKDLRLRAGRGRGRRCRHADRPRGDGALRAVRRNQEGRYGQGLLRHAAPFRTASARGTERLPRVADRVKARAMRPPQGGLALTRSRLVPPLQRRLEGQKAPSSASLQNGSGRRSQAVHPTRRSPHSSFGQMRPVRFSGPRADEGPARGVRRRARAARQGNKSR